jgi:hypothetical protein
VELDARQLIATLALSVGLSCSGKPSPDTRHGAPVARPASAAASASPSPVTSVAAAAGEAPRSVSTAGSAPSSSSEPPFPPSGVKPPFARSAEPDDGLWKPFDETNARPLLYTTLIHPHETSRFIAVTLVAIDLNRARLDFVPGVDDVGKRQVPFAPGLVPATDQAKLIAAFNGGFMPQHGRWGMRIGETTLLAPRDPGCTVAIFDDGSVKVRTWPALSPAEANIRVVRQTPPCLLEQGAVHPDLLAGRDRAWAGHTPGIVTRRRSAVGIDESGKVLFYAVGVEATPKLLALGLRAAGAHDAAQLDINWNWTRFFSFALGEGGKPSIAKALVEVEHTKRDYVTTASKRDFFYVLRRD